MPKLLSDVAPLEVPIFIPGDLAKRPELAALIAETIATWSYAENALGKSLAGMSCGGSVIAMAQYAKTQNFSGKKAILEKAAREHLAQPYLDTFLCVMGVVSRFAAMRHSFAHGIWGIVEALPDAVLLVQSKHLFAHWGEATDWVAAFAANPSKVGPGQPFRNEVVDVWTRADLEAELARMVRAFELASALEAMASVDSFDPSHTRRKHIHTQLAACPEVVAAR